MDDDEHGGYPLPLNGAPQRLANSYIVSAPCNVEGFLVTNTKASAQFICVFDAETVPADGTTPIFSLDIAASTARGTYYGSRGRVFQSGCCLVNSSTADVLTIGSADCLFDVQYDPIR